MILIFKINFTCSSYYILSDIKIQGVNLNIYSSKNSNCYTIILDAFLNWVRFQLILFTIRNSYIVANQSILQPY